MASRIGAASTANLSSTGNSVSIDRLALRDPRQQRRQAMVALRTDDEIDHGGAADDLVALCLRDAARDGDHHAAAIAAAACFTARMRPSSE